MSSIPSLSEHPDAAALLLPETREAYCRRALSDRPQPASGMGTEAGALAAGTSVAPGNEWPSHPNYELLREIGRGRYAVVYEAYERTLRRYVAVKKLENPFLDDGYHRELFWTEARFLASLEHPNIIRVFAVDEQRGWIIMELMNGCLEQKKMEGPLAPDLVRSILRQALEGLGCLHRQGRIHGEVKPGNLLIDDQGRVKLSDSPGFTAQGGFRIPVGVQRHVAPELLCPEAFGPIGPAVDLYCLGFAALELLLGHDFDGIFKGVSDRESSQDLGWIRWHRSTTERLPTLKKIIPGLPEDLIRVLDGLTRKEVADRYTSAEEALRELEDRPLMMVDLPDTSDAARQRASDPSPGSEVPRLYSRAAPALRGRHPESPHLSWLKRLGDPEELRKLWSQPAIRVTAIGLTGLLALTLMSVALSSRSKETAQAGCQVAVSSEPPTAEITLDGRRTAMITPQTMSLPPGRHQLLLAKAGYRSALYAFEIQPDETRLPIRITLERERPTAEESLRRPDEPRGDLPLPVVPIPVSPPPAEPPGNTPAPLRPTIARPPERAADGSAGGARYDPLEPYRVRPFRWELPAGLTSDERVSYMQRLRGMLDGPWSDGVKTALASAAEAHAAAARICPSDPRCDHAYALVLWKHHYLDEAATELEESARKIRWPYFAPRRQLVWHRVLRGKEERAAVDCAALLRESARFAAAGWPGCTAEQRLAAVDILEENAHYAACVFACIQACAIGGGRSQTQLLSHEQQFSVLLPARTWQRFAITKERCLRELARARAIPDAAGSEHGGFLQRRVPLSPSAMCSGLAEISRHCFPTDLEFLREELLMTLPEEIDDQYAVRF